MPRDEKRLSLFSPRKLHYLVLVLITTVRKHFNVCDTLTNVVSINEVRIFVFAEQQTRAKDDGRVDVALPPEADGLLAVPARLQRGGSVLADWRVHGTPRQSPVSRLLRVHPTAHRYENHQGED